MTSVGIITPKDVIWDCLNHYAYEDAKFLAECYFSHVSAVLDQNDEALYIVATAYYRSGNVRAAYILLQRYGAKSWKTKFLLARCCEDLNKLGEAEEVLREFISNYSSDRQIVDAELSRTIPHALSMLARIYFKTDRVARAKDFWEKSLALAPFLWSSFERLCKINKGHLNTDVSNIFDPEKVQLRKQEVDHHQSLAVTKQNVMSKTPSGIQRSDTPKLKVLETTPTVEDTPVSCMIETETPSPNTFIAGSPPKAPRKATAKEKNEQKRVTRASRPSVLSQNQSQYSPRRSARLSHQNSVKENADSRTLRNRKPYKPKKALDCDITAVATSTAIANNNKKQLKEIKNPPEFIVPTVKATLVPERNKDKSVGVQQKTIDAVLLLESLRKFGEVFVACARYENSSALQLLDRFPENLRKTPMGVMAVARSHFEAADYRKAVEVFDFCHRSFEHYVDGIELYSTALWQREMEIELSSLAQEMTEKFRNEPQTWCVVGNCFSLQKEHYSAIKFFQRATQLNPHFVYAYTLLGHEYFAVEVYDKATQAFRTAVRLDPTHFNGWYGLGMVCYKNEQLALANEYLRRAFNINSQSSVLLCHLSVVQQALNRSEIALKLLNKALSLSDDPLCRYHKAHILFCENRLDEALEELNILKLMVPREANVFFLLGKVYKKRGDTHLALINFSRATELDPRGEQHNPMIGDRRYDEEPNALVEEEPTAGGTNTTMDSSDQAV